MKSSDASSGALPRHVAVIMDGNGRWAQARGLPRTEGHRAGVLAVREIVTFCRRRGIRHLTLYAFSSENWKRPKSEVAALFSLLVEFLGVEVPRMVREGIALKVFGLPEELPLAARTALRLAVAKTAGGREMDLNLALNYGARAEIVRAARAMAREGLPPEAWTEEAFSRHLHSAGQPDPDLVIRTGGELRLSNFLLYQSAYAELYFTPVRWPDFGPERMEEALAEYAGRQRRFGMTGEQALEADSGAEGLGG